MKNSIERDIHLLESYAGMTHKMTDNQGRPKLDQAIERILKDYKRALKENEELKNQEATQRKINELLIQRYSNSISLQKIKDKIEELIKEGRHYNANKIEVLQELLEEEK